jgi:hypothetical protein
VTIIKIAVSVRSISVRSIVDSCVRLYMTVICCDRLGVGISEDTASSNDEARLRFWTDE